MSFLLRTSLIAIAMLSSPPGQTAAQGLPPLIDRQLLFGDPEIIGAELSPDGRYLAFIKPWKSTRNVWVKKIDEPFSAARLLTTETKRPIPGFLWTRDGKYIVYRQGQRRRRELQRVRRGSRRGACGRSRCPALARPDRPEGRAGRALRRAEERSRHRLHRAQRSRQGLARPLQAEDLHRRAHADPQEHRAHRRLDLRSCRGSSAWPSAWPTTAIRNSCAWTPTASRRSTRAPSSRAAVRSGFTKTASASTWRPTRATTPTSPRWSCSIRRPRRWKRWSPIP